MPRHTRRAFLKTSGALIGGIAVGSTVTAATSTDRFIVESVTEADLAGSGLSVVHDLSSIGYMVVEGSNAAVDALGASYAPDTTYSLDLPVEEAPVPQASEATDEPLYPLQWDKQVQDIPSAHEVSRGEGTRVAVIDSGVAASHSDIAHAVNAGLSKNFTDDGLGAPGPFGGYHGTHVAGIIAANDQNDAGIVGSAPAAELVDCRVFSGETASFADIVAAILYSASIECDVANLSIGAYPVPRQGLGQFYGQLLNSVTAYARRQGTLLVVSAGNDAADLQHDASYVSLPNEAANVMSIAATGPIGFGRGDDGIEAPADSPAFYTNYGTNAIDLAAPGGDADLSAIGSDPMWYLDLVLSTMPGDDYGWAAGTSMACPQVVGAAALLKSANPDYSANQIRSTLCRTASVPSGYDKAYYGSGFVDVNAALRE